MATVTRLGIAHHLRAEPNQFILHYRNGRAVREGAGIAYWFNPLSASVAQLPVEDCETTFVLTERSADLQQLSVQVTLRFRIRDPKRAAERFNFTISLGTGRWTESPLETLANVWAERGQDPARRYLASVPLTDAIRDGAERIRDLLDGALRDDDEIAAMGLGLVDVRVIRVAPTSELEKALQTPTREAIRQTADEAVFRRRAEAVEQERAIKQNELATQIELERRQEALIERRGANRLLEAESDAKDARVRAEAEADATRMIDEAKAHGEKMRVDVWKEASGRVLFGLAFQDFARKIEQIQHLNVSPNLLGQAFEQMLLDGAET